MAMDRELRAQLKRRYTEATGDVVIPSLSQLPYTRPVAYEDGKALKSDAGNAVRDVYPEYTQGLKDEFGNFLVRPQFPTINDGNDMGADDIGTDNLKPVNIANLDVPTSSSNVSRPRTLAAGYYLYVGERAKPYADQRGKITVMFRDGTFYNYYDVPPGVWQTFRNSVSKGPMLNRRNRFQSSDGVLLSFPHGPADVSEVPEELQRLVYRTARGIGLSNQVTKPRSVRMGKLGEYDVYRRTGSETFGRGKTPGEQYGYIPKSAQKQTRYSKGKMSSNSSRGKNPFQK